MSEEPADKRSNVQAWFPILAIVAVVLLLAAGGAAYYLIEEQKNAVPAQLKGITTGMVTYCFDNKRLFPDHAGLLKPYVSEQVLRYPWNRGGPMTPPLPTATPTDTAYRVGDFIFINVAGAKLGGPHILLISTPIPGSNIRWIGYSDGSVMGLRDPARFEAEIANENSTRRTHNGLPPIDLKLIEALEKPLAPPGSRAMNEAHRQKLQGWFPIIAMVCVVLLILFGGGLYLRRTAIPEAIRSASAANLRMMGMAMSAYASAYGNKYPDHVGRMIPSWCPAKGFVHPGNPNKTPPTYGGEARPGPVYRVGDVIFLYDPATEVGKFPHDHIVAVSVTDFDPEWRNAVRADGSVIRFHVKSFEMAGLAPDNTARKAAGLPEITFKEIEALEHPAATTP